MKRIITLLLVSTPLLILSQNITDSLLLYYPMNGNAADLSGNNFHGTSSGVTSVDDRHGVPNSAYYFDGVDDYIDFPLNDTLKPQFPITFAFWVNLNIIAPQENKLFMTDFTQNSYHGAWMTVDMNGYLRIGYGYGLGGCNSQNGMAFKATEFPVDTGIWYHFTGIINAPYDMELYIDCNNAGAVWAWGANTYNATYSNNASGTLGRIDNNTTLPPRYFDGYMDEFTYWERALSAAEVYTLCDSMPIMSTATTWNCINNACVDPGNGTGLYATYSSCNAVCNTTVASWDCIAGACIDPGTGLGQYSSMLACQTDCKITALEDVEVNKDKVLLRVVNVLGKEVRDNEEGVLFYIYDDGTVVKRIKIISYKK